MFFSYAEYFLDFVPSKPAWIPWFCSENQYIFIVPVIAELERTGRIPKKGLPGVTMREGFPLLNNSPDVYKEVAFLSRILPSHCVSYCSDSQSRVSLPLRLHRR